MQEGQNENKEFLGKLFLIVGPSGSGKGTVIDRLKVRYPGFVYPVSYTTREPRHDEKEGEVYHFITKEKFKKMIEEGEFLEYAVVHANNFYGTAKKEILDALRQGAVVIREVDIQGFDSIRKIVPTEHLVSIFMEVIDREDLKGRIMRREKMSDEELKLRMQSALSEIERKGDCDYEVENKWGEIDECVANVEKIILKEIKNLY